jgi:hypothetical protein
MRYLCLIHLDEREMAELWPTREPVVDERAV